MSTLFVAAITCRKVEEGGGWREECGEGRKEYLNVAVRGKAVQLVKELQHCPLDFSISLLLTGKSLNADT